MKEIDSHVKPDKEEFVKNYFGIKRKMIADGRLDKSSPVPLLAWKKPESKFHGKHYKKFWTSYSDFLKDIGEIPKNHTGSYRSVPKAQLIEEYYKLKKKLGSKKVLTPKQINKLGKHHVTTYVHKFGKWSAFLESIGEIKKTDVHDH
jgi:hypothetical protein